MVRSVNMHEAKTHLSKLVAEVENGEDIVLTRKGVPAARLVALSPQNATVQNSDREPPFSPELLEDWDDTDAKVLELFRDHLPSDA